jgi:hypothetical protein
MPNKRSRKKKTKTGKNKISGFCGDSGGGSLEIKNNNPKTVFDSGGGSLIREKNARNARKGKASDGGSLKIKDIVAKVESGSGRGSGGGSL